MRDSYLELKLSWELFQKPPESLSTSERGRLTQVTARQSGIEQAILAAPEAANVIVPRTTLDNRLAEIRQRYGTEAEMMQDLERAHLAPEQLEAAVERDLRVEAVLDKVAAQVAPATAVEAEIYYRLHPEAFDRPEARKLRHVLVTHNNAKEKAMASATLEKLRKTATNAEAFGAAALRHSQCPTAMEGGQLGVVKRKQLYAELEPAAFALAVGEISSVLESPIGLHIIFCEEILPSGMISFGEVRDRIVERLSEKRRREAQRDWIRQAFVRPAKG